LAGGNRLTVYLSRIWTHPKGYFAAVYGTSGLIMGNSKDWLKIALCGTPRGAFVQFELFNSQVFVAKVKGFFLCLIPKP
jgi:hypothetical protein